jgi:putative addiction module component (TIGR02574 family)
LRVGHERRETQTDEVAIAEGDRAVRIAELERRVESHDIVLGMLQTICNLMKDPNTLHLTEARRAELNRRLDEFEKSGEAGSPWPEVKNRIRKSC